MHYRKFIQANYLADKILPELIDDHDIRMKEVKLFLNDLDPSLEHEVIPLHDLYGPTKTDPSFEVRNFLGRILVRTTILEFGLSI